MNNKQPILTESDSRPQASRVYNLTTSKISGDSAEDMIISRALQIQKLPSMPTSMIASDEDGAVAGEQELENIIQEAAHEET